MVIEAAAAGGAVAAAAAPKWQRPVECLPPLAGLSLALPARSCRHHASTIHLGLQAHELCMPLSRMFSVGINSLLANQHKQ